MPAAVVLLSGGLDSATTLAIARSQGFECHALSVYYGQRHSAELDAARRVALALGAQDHRVMNVDLAGIGGSALTDRSIAVPEHATTGIPVTYVPARNTLMLSLALAWAEVLGARAVVATPAASAGTASLQPAYQTLPATSRCSIMRAPARAPRPRQSSGW
jgi:7-cyano-7-deazaguanine synthase